MQEERPRHLRFSHVSAYQTLSGNRVQSDKRRNAGKSRSRSSRLEHSEPSPLVLRPQSPKLPFQRVLVLAPHTDDELGCAGTILRCARSKAEVYCAVFSTCEDSVPDGFPKDVLRHEFKRSTEVLEIPEDRLFLYNFRVRHFPSERQNILEELVRLRKSIAPDLVLLPAFSDIHQDHQVIAHEGLRCFKFGSVLGYELPWNHLAFRPGCFVGMNSSLLERKLKALRCYKSQEFRPYANADFFRSLAKVRGTQAGVEYAEAFEVLRLRL